MSTTAEKPADSAAAESGAKAAQKSKTEKVPALKLTLGGAPETWHVVGSVGYVHPVIPSPVGGKGEPSVDVAKKLSDDPGCEVKLVQITAAQAADAREQRDGARSAGIGAAREARRTKDAPAADAEKFSTEVAAAAAGKE